MVPLVSTLLMAGLIAAALKLWLAEAGRTGDPRALRSFGLWAARGLGGPLLIWTALNSALVPTPLIPRFADALSAGKWWAVFVPALFAVMMIVTSWWAAVTCAWIGWRTIQRLEDRRAGWRLAGAWSALAVPSAAALALMFGPAGFGLGVFVWFGGVTYGVGTLVPARLPPTYSRALAKINFDKFAEAEQEIISQLEKCETDFEGWMMLAELYATHFKDLSAAERTVCEVCDDPHTTAAQAAQALHRLADWHLKIADDPDHARWALEQICARLPGTHLETMARQRIQSLPATREELLRSRQVRTLQLPAQSIPVPRPVSAAPQPWDPGSMIHVSATPRPMPMPALAPAPDPKQAALAEARECVAQLTANPDAVEMRERFARLLATPIGEVETAIQQLDLLLAMREPTMEQRAAWLNLQADWHAQLKRDIPAARASLQKVIDAFPQTPHAFEAQRRLFALQLETSVRQRRKLP
jgi:hypothetical protein